MALFSSMWSLPQATAGIPEPYLFFTTNAAQMAEAEKLGLRAITQDDRDRLYTKPFDCNKWNDGLGILPLK